MAIISCKECEGKVSDTAVTCPHCGAAVAEPVPVAQKTSGGVWKWVLGVPVGLFVLLMFFGAMNSDPVQDKDRRIYEQCLSDLAGLDRARSSASNTMADMCERFRNDYIRKYGRNP